MYLLLMWWPRYVKAGIQVVTLLAEQQVDVTAVKGPVLAHMLYGNVPARFYSDIDLIVPPDQLKLAIGVLTGQGYRMVRPTTRPEQFDWERYFRDLNDVGLVSVSRNVYIELHHGIYKPGLLEREEEQPFLDDRQTITIGGAEFRVPGPEAYFLYLCYHGSAHMFFRLTWLRDVARYLEGVAFDYGAFGALTAKLRMEKMVGLSLVLVRKYYNTRIPPALEPFTNGKGLRTLAWLSDEAIRGPGRASLTHNILVFQGRRERIKGIDRAGIRHWAIRLLYAVLLRSGNSERLDVFKRMFYKRWLSKKS
jgi:hypothetical protein